ncbi:hypothetical protein ATC03_14615 [Agromyces aureus]|uniref:Uncharacterized protein n=1 Tax=Agromyces aureus TaxID=453304 RepID=A0A191WHR2_9MICO|nr:hypothetical protein ATC03_14615 [Agromyces aureus]
MAQAATVRESAEQRGPSRGYLVLLVASALFVSGYVGAFLILVAGQNPTDAGGSSSAVFLLLIPNLCFSGLVEGARARFGVRSRTPRRAIVAYVILLAAFVAAAAVMIFGVDLPAWSLVLLPALLFVTMAARPLRQLLRPNGAQPAERWTNLPMRAPARVMTALLGLLFGLLTATSALPGFTFVTLGAMVLILMTMAARTTEWGFLAVGHAWGPLHWIAFGLVSCVMFGIAVQLAAAPVTVPVACVAGAFVFLVMLIAALLPRTRRAGRER